MQPVRRNRHFLFSVRHPTHYPKSRRNAAFSLIEMVAVIAVVAILLTAGVGILGGTGAQSRRVATDVLTGLIERARTEAITSRSHVVLAVAEPGDLPADDQVCRIGLFRVEEWPTGSASEVEGVLLSRWKELKQGVALIGGQVDGVDNPLDSQEITVNYRGGGRDQSVEVHALVFHSRGGLRYPMGSTPVAMRIAEGRYQDGVAVPSKRNGEDQISENLLKIGRVIARPYRFDG